MSAMHRLTMVRLAVMTAAGAALLGCTETVYKDFPGFAPPPTGAGEYLGYSTTSNKTTTCGNCHASHQQLWITSAHSNAWADLQASGHAESFCNACHSVNTNGNDTNSVATGGYVGSSNARYQDVQCEACHGAGQTHVNNPEATIPIPSIYVQVGTMTSCSACHTGTHEPYADEWSKSKHGIVPDFAAGAGNTACQPCHTGQGALVQWFNVNKYNSIYKEINNPLNTQGPNGALTIVCAVCHNPHGSQFDGQTRLSVSSLDITQNLCAQCHNRRAVPDTSSSRGPHAPEGALVIGENGEVGWRPPLMIAAPGGSSRIYGSHGDTTVNTSLCATCHIQKLQVHDTATNTDDFSTGHLFLATPCLGANGLPDTTESCAYNSTARNYTACTGSGCHASADVAVNLQNNETVTIDLYLSQLQTLLNNTAKIPCSAYAINKPLNTARGARFNYLLAAEAASTTDATCGSTRNLPPPVAKRSAATHNVPLIEQLLQYSILQVQQDYP